MKIPLIGARSNTAHKGRRAAVIVMTVGAVLGAAACGSSSSSSKSSTTSKSTTVIKITPASFTVDFSAMAQLKSLAAKGKGLIGVLLPDTTTSARYETFDRPYLTKAFEAAGLSSSDFKIDNAQGSASTMQTQAEADITNGASVLLVDALDSGSGAAIEAIRQGQGRRGHRLRPPDQGRRRRTATTSASTTSRSASSSARARSTASRRGT